ncbi:hypothetical protein [Tumebacillus algifaecis]|uniref:hypothetical protein n=1 Tax=Tumebacillus algifaecis TaxID=1214604 RepID=UPI0012FD02A6|nr:hypothetical protein [Tumebacillus algifaecis]
MVRVSNLLLMFAALILINIILSEYGVSWWVRLLLGTLIFALLSPFIRIRERKQQSS